MSARLCFRFFQFVLFCFKLDAVCVISSQAPMSPSASSALCLSLPSLQPFHPPLSKSLPKFPVPLLMPKFRLLHICQRILTCGASSNSCKIAITSVSISSIFSHLLPRIRMAMILEAQLPLPRSASSAELFSMGLRPSAASNDQVVSSADDEEIVLCF